MKGKRQGFFARLFGLGRRKDFFELSVGAVLQRIIRNALAAAEIDAPVEAERVDFDTLAGEAGAGWSVFHVRESDPADLVLFYPEETLAALCGNARDGFPPLLAEATRNIADFIRPRPPVRTPCAHHRFFRKYGVANAEETAWRASGCGCYRIRIGGEEAAARIYACVERSADVRTENAFASDPEFAEAVRVLARPQKKPTAHPPEAGERERPLSVELAAPREFVIGNLFLPPRIPCGKYRMETRFSAVSIPADRQGLSRAAGEWASVSATVSGKPWRAWFFFPAPQSAEAVKGMAGCALRQSLPEISSVLGAAAENPGVSPGSKPDLSGGTGFVLLEASISAGPARFSCSVFVDYSVVAALARRLLDPAEASSVARGPAAALVLLLSANAALFSRRTAGFHRSFLDPDRLPFATFLDLVPETDRAVILQNFLPRALGRRNLRTLFGYAENINAADGRRITRVMTPYPVDEPRLLSLLPPLAREEWEGRSPPGSAADHEALTEEMLDGIRRAAAAGSLSLSGRAALVLERFYAPGRTAAAKMELERTAADGIPYSAVRRLPKAQIQQFFAKTANRAVALSLVGAEKELAFVRANVSGKRATALAEDIAYINKLYAEGSIGITEVIETKREMERTADGMREELARQEARERAKSEGHRQEQ